MSLSIKNTKDTHKRLSNYSSTQVAISHVHHQMSSPRKQVSRSWSDHLRGLVVYTMETGDNAMRSLHFQRQASRTPCYAWHLCRTNDQLARRSHRLEQTSDDPCVVEILEDQLSVLNGNFAWRVEAL